MVNRLFSWSADSFLVRRIFYSPLAGLSFVDLTSLLTASISLLGLSLSTSLVYHYHCRPHCRLPASYGLSLLLTLLSTASIRWTYFVVYQRPASAGLSLSTSLLTASVRWAYFVNFTVDGQRPLGLPRPSRSSASAHLLVFSRCVVP